MPTTELPPARRRSRQKWCRCGDIIAYRLYSLHLYQSGRALRLQTGNTLSAVRRRRRVIENAGRRASGCRPPHHEGQIAVQNYSPTTEIARVYEMNVTVIAFQIDSSSRCGGSSRRLFTGDSTVSPSSGHDTILSASFTS